MATLRARLVVSMPAPIRLIASCWRRVRESSCGGKSESRSVAKTVLPDFSTLAAFRSLRMVEIWLLISYRTCQSMKSWEVNEMLTLLNVMTDAMAGCKILTTESGRELTMDMIQGN